MQNLLRSLWHFFHDIPRRRDDYFQITDNTLFPPHLCPHIWFEDVKVAERTLLVWSKTQSFVSSIIKNLKKKAAWDDQLTKAKLEFSILDTKQLQPLLTKFQTDVSTDPFVDSRLRYLVEV